MSYLDDRSSVEGGCDPRTASILNLTAKWTQTAGSYCRIIFLNSRCCGGVSMAAN